MIAEPRTRVALLIGGDSSEREISWKTGQSMQEALSVERFDVIVYDVTSINAECALEQLALDPARLTSEDLTNLLQWWVGLTVKGSTRRGSWANLALDVKADERQVALPALHGGWGEDGTVQSLLEVGGVPCAGSRAKASVVAMDKALCKAIAKDLGIPTARNWALDDVDALPPLAGKCVVKPNTGGSSVGVTVLEDTGDLISWRAALSGALADSGVALVEEFVRGIEVTAAVVGSGSSARALPLVEIVPQAHFYDFSSKYADGGSEHLIPPRLPESVQAQVADFALSIHRALGCRGVARSDWIVTESGEPYFLELNTLPGMTRTSLVPDAARAASVSFEALLDMLIAEALK